MCPEFSRAENRLLGALSRLDDYFRNPLIQDDSGTIPEMSRNAFGTNQEMNEDDSQSDAHPAIVDDIGLDNLGPIAKVCISKLTTSSGKLLEDNIHAHNVFLM